MSVDLRENCSMHLKMNDNAANKTVLNSISRHSDGTAQRNTNILSSAGKINQSLRSDDAIPDYITVLDGAYGIMSFAVAFWVKLSDYNNDGSFVVQRTDSGNEGIWAVRFSAAKRIHFYDYDAGYGINLQTDINAIPDDGDWHQIICQRVHDANASAYIWVDNGNTLYASQTGRPKKSIQTHPTHIGANFSGGDPIDAYFDCFGFWVDKVLTQAERDFLWNSGYGTEKLMDMSIGLTSLYSKSSLIGTPSSKSKLIAVPSSKSRLTISTIGAKKAYG